MSGLERIYPDSVYALRHEIPSKAGRNGKSRQLHWRRLPVR